MASALTGLLGSLLIKNKTFKKINADSLVYCASFAAIGVLKVAPNIIFIIVLAIVITSLFNLAKSYAVGFGGKLGTIAFVSSLIVWGASNWF